MWRNAINAAERQRRYRKRNEANAKLKECETDDVDRHVVDDKERIKKESHSNKTRKQLSESCKTNRAKSRKRSYRASKLSRCDRVSRQTLTGTKSYDRERKRHYYAAGGREVCRERMRARYAAGEREKYRDLMRFCVY